MVNTRTSMGTVMDMAMVTDMVQAMDMALDMVTATSPKRTPNGEGVAKNLKLLN